MYSIARKPVYGYSRHFLVLLPLRILSQLLFGWRLWDVRIGRVSKLLLALSWVIDRPEAKWTTNLGNEFQRGMWAAEHHYDTS